MATPKKRKSVSARALRRSGLYSKMKFIKIENICKCPVTGKYTISHRKNAK